MNVKCSTKLSGCDLFQGTVEIFTYTNLAEARKFFEGRGDCRNKNWARDFLSE
jgi:hypothetical protein